MNREKPLKRVGFKPRTTGLRRTGFKSSTTASIRRTSTTKSRRASASTVIPKPVKKAVDQRDEGCCQRCGRVIGSGEFSRHHRNPRGMGGSKADPHALVNLVLLCGSANSRGGCHYEVESRRERARIDGWLVPDGIDPAEWPVRRFGRDDYELPGVEWTPAETHPLQRMAAA